MKCLIEHGVNIDEPDNMGDTPLHCSMVFENHNYMNWGLTIEKKLISIKECDKIDTSFHPKDYDEIVKPLIENGANINVQNKEGYTPLYLAVVLEHFKSAQLLLDAGADVNIKDNEEKSVLTIVTESDHKTALEFLRKNMLLKLVRDFFSSEVRL